MLETRLDSKSLCMALLRADTEDAVTEILRNSGYLRSQSDWVFLGDSESNFSIVENQSSNAVAALVEKIVNSIEAKLIAEVRRLGIDPESDAAPSSIEEAVRTLLKAPTGHLKDIPASRRRELTEIYLLVTGGQRNPCYTIIDKGEGQAPAQWPSTLLSLPGSKRSSYKSRMKFVQGVYNMGGTGVLPFCGKRNYQLVISRRDPSIAKPGEEEWGFTIVQKRVLTDKALVFEYLAPNHAILTFSAEELLILPGEYPDAYGQPLKWGTCFKLYEYKTGSYAASHAGQDLYYELSRCLFEVALPVLIVERRRLPGFEDIHTHETVLSGMMVRLDGVAGRKLLEQDFPSSGEINVPKLGRLPVTLYLFKRDHYRSHWNEKKAITFVINGQMHHFLTDAFFDKHRVDKSYLKSDLYVVVDCSAIPTALRQELFMPSRDRFREMEEHEDLIKALEEYIHDHPGLVAYNQKRHDEQLRSQLEDQKPFEQIIQKLIKISPSLSELLKPGQAITKFTDFEWLQREGPYSGKAHPTFFRPEGNRKTMVEKECPIGATCFVQFETDAANEYFDRRKRNSGKLDILPSSDLLVSSRLWNGICSIRLRPPRDAIEGQRVPIILRLTDPELEKPFEDQIVLNVVRAKIKRPKKPSEPTEEKKPTEPEKEQRYKKQTEGEGEQPERFAAPKVDPAYQKDWGNFDPVFTEMTAVDLKPYSGSYQIYVNMDNYYLQNELRTNRTEEPEVLKMQFMQGLGLIVWAMIVKFEKESSKNAVDVDKERTETDFIKSVREVSKGIAMVLLPLINSMGKISRTVNKGRAARSSPAAPDEE